jgi:hypothetical protein
MEEMVSMITERRTPMTKYVSEPVKITDITENEDGSATLQVECDPKTFAAIFNVGFVSLIKTGLYWETDNDKTYD